MNSSRSEQRVDEFDVTGVRMMFENSIVCQCTFLLADFYHFGCDTPYAYRGWCMPDGAFPLSGVIVNNIKLFGHMVEIF
ncbi:hypothetical protein [Corynebacterium sp. HMSC034H07]|uniref:hypothetical protein n=1 Tax=Corynebacterium sp. HMSC034H07 TaxID=1739512 RepID=UPI0013018885|nr:hypothetical protein [Corynebacterium sp. HMSC034H07]